ncbi:MAG: hypothetical protein Aurels2KO_21180 [Aureliella sp.]
MRSADPVRVFIGSGEASCLERKTLIYSLRKHCSRELDVYVFNGTHDSLEHNDKPPVRVNMPLWIKYRNYTEFSNYRFLIPELCNHRGRAIFLDSDMVCLADIAEFFDQPMGDFDMLGKGEAYQGEACWGMSQILFDCSRSYFDITRIFNEMDAGSFANIDLHQMRTPFLEKYPFKIGAYSDDWNVFDKKDESTKLIHYTNLNTQPWKFPGHPHEDIWFEYFCEARQAGFITDEDISKTLNRAYARQDILQPDRAQIANELASRPEPKRRERRLKKVEQAIKALLPSKKRRVA